MTPPLITRLKLPFQGASPPLRSACKMVIGLELGHLQRELGYEGSGTRPAFLRDPETGPHPNWQELCKAEAGITDDTARNYMRSATALKNRLSGSKWKNAKWLIDQMGKRPSDLTDEERTNMIECIAGEIGDSPARLLIKEQRAVEACDIPESLPDSRAKVIRAEAMLKVMKEELQKREERAKLDHRVNLVLKALATMREAGTRERYLKP